MFKEIKTRGTGLIEEMNEDIPFLDEVVDMGAVELPKSFAVEGLEFPNEYKIEGMEYEYQGKTMTCVSNALTTLAEHYVKQKTGVVKKFSQVHLFFSSGGSSRGSSIARNINTAERDGLISYAQEPLPNKPYEIKKEWFITEEEVAESIGFTGAYKIPNTVKVSGNWKDLKSAMFLYKRPILVAVRIAGNYYSDMNWKGARGRTNHVLILAGWDELNRPIMFDTMHYVKRNGGYRTFGAGYEFYVGYMIKTLDENWEKKRDKARGEFEHCLNHYGKPRNFLAEVKNGEKIKKSFSRFKNRSVYEAMGRFVHIYNNAYTYGGYTMTDLYNDCYNWRRTGSHIFPFDLTREEWKRKIKS